MNFENGNLKNALTNAFNKKLRLVSGSRDLYTSQLIFISGEKNSDFKKQIENIKLNEYHFYLKDSQDNIIDYIDEKFIEDIKKIGYVGNLKPKMIIGKEQNLLDKGLVYFENTELITKLMIEYIRRNDPEIDEVIKAIENTNLLIDAYQNFDPKKDKTNLDKKTLRYIQSFF